MATESSDVDILIELERGCSLLDLPAIKQDYGKGHAFQFNRWKPYGNRF
jgi:hypothetical protein